VPRESIFIATLNPNATRQYLKDDENRRYWPVTTGVFDLAKLVANRDQYFAEAVHRYRAGEKNYIEDKALESEVKYQQSLRKEVHPWTELIAPWAALRPHGFTIVELYTLCLGMSGHQVSSTHIRTRVYGILKDLGYEYRAEVGAGSWKKRIKTWEELI
jgi:predicted P-loop ATPase